MVDYLHHASARERKHICAINSSPEFLALLRDLLEGEGFRVTTAIGAPATFDQIAAGQPQLIILDLAAGHAVCWDLLERLHREAVTRQIPILLTSTDPRLLAHAAADVPRYGEHPMLAKPLDLDDLLATVARLIGAA